MSTRQAIILLGVVQAILYCTLLPLWEGIDEPFHYAYVQHLVQTKRFPELEKTPLSEEVRRSMSLAPASHVVASQIPWLTTFTEYFKLPAAERARRRAELEELPRELGGQPGGGDNYEAQQPPLAYLILAPIEWAQTREPLLRRVWTMRMAGALAALAMLLFAIWRIGERMRLGAPFVNCAAFCLVCTQNLWGSVAHVANDWLSLPLLAMLVVAAERYWSKPGAVGAVWLGCTLAAGLLTKSYFLLLAPVALAAAVWRSRRWGGATVGLALLLAGGWYARNLALYGNLSGLQRATRSVGLDAAMTAASGVDWPAALAGMARGALWSGNGSFTTFSADTLNIMLCILVAGWVLYVRKVAAVGWSASERMLAAVAAAFSTVPLYAMLIFGSLYGRVSPAANSWYAAGLLPFGFLLASGGLEWSGTFGVWAARVLAALSAYVSAATYWAKLIPLYSGHEGSMRPRFLLWLYSEKGGEVVHRLGETALGSGGILIMLAAMEATLAVIVFGKICRALSDTARDAQWTPANPEAGSLGQERVCSAGGGGCGSD